MTIELTEEQKLEIFKEQLARMGNEELGKMLLNKSLQKLAVLLEEDMATAADYNVIRAILKDNNIGIVPTRDNAAGKVVAKLKERAAQSQAQPGVIPLSELENVDINDFIARH